MSVRRKCVFVGLLILRVYDIWVTPSESIFFAESFIVSRFTETGEWEKIVKILRVRPLCGRG